MTLLGFGRELKNVQKTWLACQRADSELILALYTSETEVRSYTTTMFLSLLLSAVTFNSAIGPHLHSGPTRATSSPIDLAR